MLKVCLVKEHSCYDLYKVTGSDPRRLVESSNWRSGPIGLWEAFDCEFRIVSAHPERECRIGEKYWKQYVKSWDVWPEGYVSESSNAIDWSKYHIVITVDVAIPTRIVRRFPHVMWCYYFVEEGPRGIDTLFKGGPQYGYNVFLNHRPAKSRISSNSAAYLQMIQNRRAAIDFPYYLQSSKTIQGLYPEYAKKERDGIVLGHHSYTKTTPEQQSALNRFGRILKDYKTISDIHKLELQSKYYIMHPESTARAGLGMVEAISAGCLALAPSTLLWGFPELVNTGLNYSSFSGLLEVLRYLEENEGAFDNEYSGQRSKVDKWFFEYPSQNLIILYEAFKKSRCGFRKQWLSEKAECLMSFPCRTKSIVKRRMAVLKNS